MMIRTLPATCSPVDIRIEDARRRRERTVRKNLKDKRKLHLLGVSVQNNSKRPQTHTLSLHELIEYNDLIISCRIKSIIPQRLTPLIFSGFKTVHIFYEQPHNFWLPEILKGNV